MTRVIDKDGLVHGTELKYEYGYGYEPYLLCTSGLAASPDYSENVDDERPVTCLRCARWT